MYKKINENYCNQYTFFVIIFEEKNKRGKKMKNYEKKANLISNIKAFFIVALFLTVFK